LKYHFNQFQSQSIKINHYRNFLTIVLLRKEIINKLQQKAAENIAENISKKGANKKEKCFLSSQT